MCLSFVVWVTEADVRVIEAADEKTDALVYALCELSEDDCVLWMMGYLVLATSPQDFESLRIR